MKLCMCCAHYAEDEANSCEKCGEGSWGDASAELLPGESPPHEDLKLPEMPKGDPDLAVLVSN